jgi:thioesterase domain-containing protein
MPTIEKLRRNIGGEQADSDAIEARRRQISRTWTSRMRSEGLIELRRGGPGRLFLVHDGEGETLLYLNLARRMPNDFAVFAIEPRRIARVPLAHTTIEEMAGFYIEVMRTKQPQGPYLLGGLCAGGVIAYEMASQLTHAGESVELVALLEAALPKAMERPGRATEQRLARLKQAITQPGKSGRAPLMRAAVAAGAILHKLLNAPLWKISEWRKQLWARARFRLLRRILKREAAWPRIVPSLSVRQIYDGAQARYAPKPLPITSIVLVRAQTGEGDDTPYREIYADETFGWKTVARGVTVVDVDGGHSTMLEDRFADSVAKALLPYLEVNHFKSESSR